LHERAMVFTLGIFIYCLFEGLSNPRNSIANAFPFETHHDVEFPEFKRTPTAVRDIIWKCTGDGWQWKHGQRCRIVRVDGKLVIERLRKGREENTEELMEKEVARELLNTGMRWWEEELAKAERFFKSDEWERGDFGNKRPTLLGLLEMIEEVQETWGKFKVES